jgi:hypothetical protein
VGADRGTALGLRAPAVQQTAQALTESFQVFKLVADQLANVRTWRTARALDSDDVFDLSQREAQPPRAPDEAQDFECFTVINAIARCRPARRRQDAGGFI